MSHPIDLFREWHREAADTRVAELPNAMCLSTVDPWGTPHARFVDLKAIRPDGLVFCTSYRSPKSRHIEGNPNVSLTFWWDPIGRQVRVLGSAARISDAEADAFFADRNRDAQLASWAFDQSALLETGEAPAQWLASVHERFGAGEIPRPPHWGGYLVRPRRVEFLRFDAARTHERVLYELQGSDWVVSQLQP